MARVVQGLEKERGRQDEDQAQEEKKGMTRLDTEELPAVQNIIRLSDPVLTRRDEQ